MTTVTKRATVVIVVDRYDYVTCDRPVPGIGHCNATIPLSARGVCMACVARDMRAVLR